MRHCFAKVVDAVTPYNRRQARPVGIDAQLFRPKLEHAAMGSSSQIHRENLIMGVSGANRPVQAVLTEQAMHFGWIKA